MPLPKDSQMSLSDYKRLDRLKRAAAVAKRNLSEARRAYRKALDRWSTVALMLRTKYFT